MSIFALGILLPLLTYCVVQAVRDFRAGNLPMCAWGAIMAAATTWGVAEVFRYPGY